MSYLVIKAIQAKIIVEEINEIRSEITDMRTVEVDKSFYGSNHHYQSSKVKILFAITPIAKIGIAAI